ncbi:MAG: Uncharacterised protein [Methanobacteriota archaeon]|nr:MAG: Uncharacterised protein [Euryarchaeota archaeon]
MIISAIGISAVRVLGSSLLPHLNVNAASAPGTLNTSALATNLALIFAPDGKVPDSTGIAIDRVPLPDGRKALFGPVEPV